MTVDFDRDEAAFFDRCVESGQLPRNDAEKQIVLERVIGAFADGERYDAMAVNETLGEHFDDPVLVRRELVNFGYLVHDNREGTYEVGKRELTADDYRAITRLERHAKDLGVLE